MTEQGRANFLAWLDTPTGGSTRAIRMEFLTRLYFLNLYFPENIAQAFVQQRLEAEIHLQRLQKTLSTLPDEQIYNRLSVEMRLRQLHLVLEWLEECQKNFQKVGK
jgi:hypothetical protein